MATATILQLIQALGLTGGEQFEGVQNGVSVRISIQQILALLPEIITPTGPTQVIVGTPAAGANNNYNCNAQMGPAVGFMDLTPTAACNITGIQAGFDGQVLVVTNKTANDVTLNALNSGSVAANQFRMPADLILTQNNSQGFRYSASLALWVEL
jgi:hypothetical protein